MIEFAFVGPAFIAIVLAIFQTSILFLGQQGLETTAENASRLLMTGQAQVGGMSASQFKTAACAALPPYMKCANLLIDVKTVTSYNAATLAPPTLTYDSGGNVNTSMSYSPGGAGAIVVMRMMYLWPTAPGPLGFKLANQPGNKRLLIATSVLKTEVY